ncbi:hypothetical protein ACF3DV_06450 [Chlorogloeopsis fritschii PCC 9212]|uniref:Uncharacterized protein n=2 Tax=Chlorogloeopsis TaxID=1123 RepID=A0A3S0ZUQ1_CHLFR|nr:hypothetical protein [Chlorogloeopsis fritschii]RUR72690.1 hypothetical protein PCC6912_61560 [Chlorogloeopsis fritschii PCC 6912]
MRTHLSILSKQYAFLPAENTKMRKQNGILRKHLDKTRKQTGILLNDFKVTLKEEQQKFGLIVLIIKLRFKLEI